jgi:hypothetical protein
MGDQTMRRTFSIPPRVWIVAALLGSFSLATNTASADHLSYRFTGPTVGCHGEVHMIRALELLERVFVACPAERPALLCAAHREINQAAVEATSRVARYYLRQADTLLHRFEYTGSILYLDHTADSVERALLAEQHAFCHARPVVPVPPTPPVVHVPGHGHGHGHGHSHGSLYIGGKNFGFRINF